MTGPAKKPTNGANPPRANDASEWTVIGRTPPVTGDGDYSWRQARPRPLSPGLYISKAAEEVLEYMSCSARDLVTRHMKGDWGQVSSTEARRNRYAMDKGRSRIFSKHLSSSGEYVGRSESRWPWAASLM